MNTWLTKFTAWLLVLLLRQRIRKSDRTEKQVSLLLGIKGLSVRGSNLIIQVAIPMNASSKSAKPGEPSTPRPFPSGGSLAMQPLPQLGPEHQVVPENIDRSPMKWWTNG